MSTELFDVHVSANKMEASVSLTRHGIEAVDVQAEDVLRALKQGGVLHGQDLEIIEKSVLLFRSPDRNTIPISVAFGTEPKAGDSGAFESVVAYGDLAHGARVVARLGEGLAPEPGINVFGEEIEPPATQVDMVVGENILFEEQERSWVAECPGYLFCRDGAIHLTPLIEISENAMAATAVFRGNVPSAKVLAELLVEAGITYGSLARVLTEIEGKAVAPTESPFRVVVARGKPPIRGRNARLQYCVDIGRVGPGELRTDGTINYRKRQTFCLVDADEVIAIRVPPTLGSAGSMVTGGAIDSEPGQDRPLEAGQNVVSPDKRQFIATARGAAVQSGDRLDVHTSYAITGDVDYHVGNIECPIGVVIDGDVRSAFEIDVKGNVTIGGTIEDAIIQVQGDLTVTAGVLQGRLGSVACGGNLKARFMENTRASVRGHIEVDDNVMNCSLVAGGRIEVLAGKGIIIGGHTAAVDSIEAKVFGSRMNVRTMIQVGVSFAALQPIEQRLRDVEREMASIVIGAGSGFFRVLENTEEPEDPQLQQYLRRWRRLERKRNGLEEKRSLVITRSAGQGQDRADVIVHEVAHAGTVLVFGGRRSLLLKNDKPAGRFYWDDESNRVCFIPKV